MPKKKDYLPETMDELEKIHYGDNKDGKNIDQARLRRRNVWVKNKLLSPQWETQTVQLFSPLGKVQKIPKAGYPTFDFKIEAAQLLVEATSVDIEETSPPTLTNPSEAVNFILAQLEGGIDHVLEKEASTYSGYLKGGVILYTVFFDLYTSFGEWLMADPVELHNILPAKLDFLILRFQPAAATQMHADGTTTPLDYPIVVYLRSDETRKRLEKIFINQKYIVRHVS